MNPIRVSLLVAAMALAGGAPAFARDMPSFTTSAVNLVGWDGIAPDKGGQLQLADDGIAFVQDGVPHRIAWQAIRRFAIEGTSRGLIRGTGGTLAAFAPQGAGQLYSVIRPGAQALSLLYTDDNQALHAAVVILPKDSRDGVQHAFAQAGLQPAAVLTEPAQDQDGEGGAQAGRGEILVLFPQASTQLMPAAYAAELYEHTVAEVAKSGRYTAVWRDGDVRGQASGAVLSTTITRVRKGSARARGALPVVGMFLGKTLIEADIRLTDASGGQAFNARLKGAKSMPGESIGASKALARNVSRALEKAAVRPASAPDDHAMAM